MDSLKYPIGPYSQVDIHAHADRERFMDVIGACPSRLRDAVAGLSAEQLDTPYREGGWTVRQVIHHLFDSHANAYIRFRLALTEDTPRITAYQEASWAELDDTFSIPVEVSLDLMDGLHARLVATIRAMSADDFARKLDHPEVGIRDLDWMLQQYAWHGEHHIAHINSLKQRKGW